MVGESSYAVGEPPGSAAEIAFFVSDVEAMWEQVRDRVEVIQPLERMPWGSYKFVVRDPDGHPLAFVKMSRRMNSVHVVTLAVADMDRALRFYRDGLGFETSVTGNDPPIIFFQSDGVTLALCPREEQARDIDEDDPPQGEGFGGVTLAYVAREQDEVDRIMDLAERAGGEIIKPPRRVFWGGYSGYFRDPEGYHWEVMYWEDWRFKKDGSLLIE